MKTTGILIKYTGTIQNTNQKYGGSTMMWIKRMMLLAAMVWMGQGAVAQYAANMDKMVDKPLFMNEFNSAAVSTLHGNAPDSLTNKTDVEIHVDIRDSKNTTYPGLQRKNGQTQRTLQPTNTLEINAKRFRTGNKPGNKVELVITIPGVQDSLGNWDIKQVKWNLGKGHNPTYTKLNYLGRKEGYQIIFVYENGLAPRGVEKSQQHMVTHVQGHICEPNDPDPSCDDDQ